MVKFLFPAGHSVGKIRQKLVAKLDEEALSKGTVREERKRFKIGGWVFKTSGEVTRCRDLKDKNALPHSKSLFTKPELGA